MAVVNGADNSLNPPTVKKLLQLFNKIVVDVV